MANSDDIFINAINHWRDEKGKGTALIPYPLNDKLMLLGILQRIYQKNPNAKTLIVTFNFTDRSQLIEFITHQEDSDENNKEFKKLLDDKLLKILTMDFIVKNNYYPWLNLCIIYHPDKLDYDVNKLLLASTFKLVIINTLGYNNDELLELYKIAPLLSDFKQHEVEAIRLSTPVEETQIGVTISTDNDDYRLLEYYNEYITTSVTIFGTFDVINQVNSGNQNLNISSNQLCLQIAKNNGWNEHLDMNIEFNREIDKLYNPMSLKERACMTYEIIRKRSQFLSDYNGKLEAILDIVKNNSTDKILIINKRGDFASKITDTINSMSETDICANYHDKVESIPAIDINGNPLYVKSGVHKGERRMMACKAQKSLNEERFNRDFINILSTNAAPDKDLTVDIDTIIITSPMCEDIKAYMYRLANVRFKQNKLKLFTIYCKNTMEEKLLRDKDNLINHNVKNITTDENNIDFVVGN